MQLDYASSNAFPKKMVAESDISPEETEPKERIAHPFRTLREVVDYASGKTLPINSTEEGGLAEHLPFPFLGIVGQREMKLALLLGLVNPAVGGILLVGPRGTAKTTTVRSLLDILPKVDRSLCYYGCLPEDIESGGVEAVCPDCAKKYAEGQPLVAPDRVRLVELPLNSRIDDVVGGINERTGANERQRLRRGILAQADRNILYIDEINLLSDEIVDVILDAAAQGSFTVRRDTVSASYHARFTLIGSMNPEEGRLRPQILDRFGLRVIVRGLENPTDRLEAYRRVRAYIDNPRKLNSLYASELLAAAKEIQTARSKLPRVILSDKVARPAIRLIKEIGIDSLRSEITWFEAARAYTAADGRTRVSPEDLQAVAPMALRLRRSPFMSEYLSNQAGEEEEIGKLVKGLTKRGK
jgi:magnesium chelatase subunit I